MDYATDRRARADRAHASRYVVEDLGGDDAYAP